MNRMRVVELTRSFFLGGTEGQVVELVRGLSTQHDVKLAVLDEAGPLMESVWKLGHIPRAFPLKGSAMSGQTAYQILRMARWLHRVGAELLHVHDFYATLLAVPAAKLAGCKVVVGRLDLAHWHGWARREVLALLTRMADHVVANADAVRRMLVTEEHLPEDRITVIRNGLDLKQFDRVASTGLQTPLPETGDAPVAVLVANMNHPVKRQEDFLTALAQVRQHRDIRGFLVGDGPRREQLEHMAWSLGLGGAVHFLGHRRDVPALYRKARFGVLCSSAEGLSNAVIEGMAAGLPMVVTRAGGNPELVVDGERGWVVDAFQPQALAGALLRLASNPEQARKMGENGRAFVERELTFDRLVSQHEALYHRVLQSPQRSATWVDATRWSAPTISRMD